MIDALLRTWNPALAALLLLPTLPASASELVAPGAQPELLAEDFGFTEGPAWNPRNQTLYFSDIPNKTLHQWTEQEGVTLLRTGEQASNGIAITADDRLRFCEVGGLRVVEFDPETGEERTFCDAVEGAPLGQPNDIWIAPDGSTYFTIPDKSRRIPRLAEAGHRMGALIRVAPDGNTVSDVSVDIQNLNGVVGSADGKRLYHTGVGECRVLDILEDGRLARPRRAAPAGSDGLALDEQGNLYTTAKEGVEVYGPDAGLVERIPFPESPANLTFGGPEGRTLFVTARTGLYALEMQVRGDGFAEPDPEATGVSLDPKTVMAFFNQHCFECHDEDQREGELDLTQLGTALDDPKQFLTWGQVLDRVESGEMPPEKKERPQKETLERFLDHVEDGLVTFEQGQRKSNGRAMVRRLSRSEYENSLRELLHLPHLDIAAALPPEGSAHGYDKSSEALDFSHVHASKLMEVADQALRSALAPQVTRPHSQKLRWEVKDPENFGKVLNGFSAMLRQSRAIPLNGMKVDTTMDLVTGNFNQRKPGTITDRPPKMDGLVTFNNGEFNLGMSIRSLKPTVAGYYTIRVHGFGVMNDHGELVPSERTETVGLYSHDRVLGYVDLPPYQPTTAELKVWLEADDVIKPLVASAPFDKISVRSNTKPGDQTLEKNKAFRKFRSNGVAFRWFELEGPHVETWPPESHRRLFGDLPMQEGRIEDRNPNTPDELYLANVTPKHPLIESRRLLREFLIEALRRPFEPEDLVVPMGLVHEKLERGDPFLEAMIAGYRAILTSPEFLLLHSKAGPLEDWALAERLSYFLWQSPPDTFLRNLARRGALTEPDTLRSQVNRMLKDPRSDRFITHFLDKWLKLEDIALTEPDANLYPDYTPLLMESSLWESQAYFREMLSKDLAASHVVASDFLMVNQRLAELYELDGVQGNAIRRVARPKDNPRGGFLTQAAVLKTTANGTVTSPVVRGDFVMTHFLGDPPPPPPPTVPAVEPDISGVTTVREQLAVHREIASCAACHQKIDPAGFALESFDVMGGFRQHYRSLDQGTPLNLLVDGRPAGTKRGLPVDASGELPDGTTFRGIRDFREWMLGQQDQIGQHLLRELIVYATGAPVSFADRREFDRLATEAAEADYRLRSMIHLLVQSPLFLHK